MPRALLVGLLLVVPAIAGCTDEPAEDTVRPGSTPGGGGSGAPLTSSPPPPQEFRPRGTSERWHFHDYWKGSPTITLFEGNITFNATPAGRDGLPSLSAVFTLPHGVIVPPETGYLTFNVTWESDPTLPSVGGLVNITYKPADSNDFFPGGDTGNGVPLVVNTTESNCDVPHRQASAWLFNITAMPDANVPPGVPPPHAKVNITATIGRPLFIDPPHLNWWRDGDIIPLVEGASGEFRSALTPAANVTLPGGLPGAPAQPPNPSAVTATHRVPVDEGRIVPEGTRSIVVMLNWTSSLPDAKLTLRYAENNYPTEGPLELAVDGDGARIFTLRTTQPQTDTTYSNRTTWEFHVVPEGEPVAAFDGSFTLVAWASRLEPQATLAMVTAPST
ncbi:MAG TPA: hypothetical protein VFH78_06185 [Candidatus Thermoplasmatota archaeon]|nr:hypothetical protein [Candidatus Thermoplasmatota archaeon]